MGVLNDARRCRTAAVFAAAAAIIAAAGPRSELIGLGRLEHLENLPILDGRARVVQISSFDRRDGNDDRNTWLRREASGEYVLFEDDGPGCLYRMWLTYLREYVATDNVLRVYFDGEPTARVERTVAELFIGTNTPFLAPLVGTKFLSAGGCFCYVPMPYRSGCKVTVSNLPPLSERSRPWPADWAYYQFTAHRYDSPEGVATWTGAEDTSRPRAAWSAPGVDPKPTNGNAVIEGTLAIPAGATGTLAVIHGAGRINAVLLDPEPHPEALLNAARIEMEWDGRTDVGVRAPLGAFFGSSFGETAVSAVPLGMRTNGPYYCFWPMPFWTSAVLRVVNPGPDAITQLWFSVHHSADAYDADRAGYFVAESRARVFDGVDYRDAVLWEAHGRGHMVGLSLAQWNPGAHAGDLAYLEGDERVFIDGAGMPALHGTGVEDYFNGGWYYFNQRFSRPLHGAPLSLHTAVTNWTQSYRFHIGDALPFGQSIRFGLEPHPGVPAGARWRSVAYGYLQPGRPGLSLSAELDVADPAAEAAFAYSGVSNNILPARTLRYPGTDADALIADDGRDVGVRSQFTVPLAAGNGGMVLRRRTDADVAPQRAEVWVDGVWAGTWNDADESFTGALFPDGVPSARWRDSEFLVPLELTAGKTSVTVRIERTVGSLPWRERRYWAYSILPLVPSDDLDGDGLPDTWETRYFSHVGACDPPDDPDGDGAPTDDEYAADTNPTDPFSCFAIRDIARNGATWLAAATSSSRWYQVQSATSLTAAAWTDLGEPVRGTGELTAIPATNDAPRHFFRLRIAPPPP